jgi:drug/metabolite transporter (DMT)-like permease
MNLSNQQRGTLFIVLSATAYSFFSLWVKNLQAAELGPLDIAFWRFLFAVPAFWLVVAALRLPATEKPLPRAQLLGMGILLTGSTLLAFLGLEKLPASTFIVLFYTSPALVALMALLTGERLPRSGWVALCLTLIGTFLTVPDFGQGLSGDNLTGVALALLSAFVVALYYMVSSRLLRGHNSTGRATAWSMVGAFLPILVLTPFRTTTTPADISVWGNLLGLIVVSTVFPVFFLHAGIQKIGPARAAILGTLEPLLTIVWAAVFLGERLEPIQLLGGALILASVVILQVGGSRRDAGVKS